MAVKYSEDQKRKIEEIRDRFRSLDRDPDVDYRPHDELSFLNIDRELSFWKYRVDVFASKSSATKAPTGDVDHIVQILNDVLKALDGILGRIPNSEAADSYLKGKVDALYGNEEDSRQRARHRDGQPDCLLTQFNSVYWDRVPDDVKVKEVVKEVTRDAERKVVLTGSCDLSESYRKSEVQVQSARKRMSNACLLGLVALAIVALISFFSGDQPLPFHVTLPINFLILLYCSIEIRRFLIDAKNRDIARNRLTEFNSLPKLDEIDAASRSEIVKGWYSSFNRPAETSAPLANMLKALFNQGNVNAGG